MGEFKDLMVDIETLGVSNNSVILSLAAVEFNKSTGETGKKFYKKISIESCLEAGLVIDADTLQWWMEKPNKVRAELFKGSIHLQRVLELFNSFMAGKNYKVWANSPAFDLVLLKSAYKSCKMKEPWHFRDEMDVRTLDNLLPKVRKNTSFKGDKHNALDDCYHQIKYLSSIFRELLWIK